MTGLLPSLLVQILFCLFKHLILISGFSTYRSFSFSLAITNKISVDFFSFDYLDVSVHRIVVELF